MVRLVTSIELTNAMRHRLLLITVYLDAMVTVLGTSEYDILHDFQEKYIARKIESHGVFGLRMAWHEIRTVGIKNIFEQASSKGVL